MATFALVETQIVDRDRLHADVIGVAPLGVGAHLGVLLQWRSRSENVVLAGATAATKRSLLQHTDTRLTRYEGVVPSPAAANLRKHHRSPRKPCCEAAMQSHAAAPKLAAMQSRDGVVLVEATIVLSPGLPCLLVSLY